MFNVKMFREISGADMGGREDKRGMVKTWSIGFWRDVCECIKQ